MVMWPRKCCAVRGEETLNQDHSFPISGRAKFSPAKNPSTSDTNLARTPPLVSKSRSSAPASSSSSCLVKNVTMNVNIHVQYKCNCNYYPRYINNELEEGRPVSSKSVYPRNSVLDSKFGQSVNKPRQPGQSFPGKMPGFVYIQCPNPLFKLKSEIDRF